MRILIVGGSSALGKVLRSELKSIAEIITAGRRDSDIFLNLNGELKDFHIPNDIDAVIHSAAMFGGLNDEEILQTEYTNVLGTLKLCQASSVVNVKHFILISSIFSNIKIGNSFSSIYSLSKKHSEDVAKFICLRNNMPLTILKPSQLYGSSDSFRKNQPFFYEIINRAQKGIEISFFGNSSPKRNFIHVQDIAKVVALVVKKKLIGEYDCIHPQDTTFLEIAEIAKEKFNSKSEIKFYPEKPNVADNIFEYNETLYNLLNYYPEITINKGIELIAECRKESYE